MGSAYREIASKSIDSWTEYTVQQVEDHELQLMSNGFGETTERILKIYNKCFELYEISRNENPELKTQNNYLFFQTLYNNLINLLEKDETGSVKKTIELSQKILSKNDTEENKLDAAKFSQTIDQIIH